MLVPAVGLILLGTALLAGCAGSQSALMPRGPDAADSYLMTWVMVLVGSAIFIVVMALALLAFVPRRRRGGLGGRALIVGGGIVLPCILLPALLAWEMPVLARIHRDLGAGALTVEVVGRQFWWEIRYRTDDGPVVSANRLVLPAHDRVQLELSSGDVLHSLWIPSLGGKRDLIPGRVNRMSVATREPVTLRGQCAEFCGDQHALMAFDVEVLPPEQFGLWLAREGAPAEPPRTPLLEHGRDLFLENGCGSCHAVRGTAADGRIGPDLTHLGSRPTIAAGSFPNNVGTLAGWIADAQHLKPGNGMPSYVTLDGESVRLIATWLASLR
jgi:cytochrome c oxidase subunit 2